MNILLLEDDTAIAAALETFLTEKGCRVTCCASLSRARSLLETALPDVAVLDWNLPDGEGTDLCRELRQRWPRLPLLLLTVRSDTRDILAGFDCGRCRLPLGSPSTETREKLRDFFRRKGQEFFV